MRRYLILGHRTLGGDHLLDHVRALHERDPANEFHVVVPVIHPTDHGWTDFEVRDRARTQLDKVIAAFADEGIEATGEVGDANPVTAVADVLIREGVESYNGLILSTLPERHSHWWDLSHRLADTFPDLPITHLVASEDSLGAFS